MEELLAVQAGDFTVRLGGTRQGYNFSLKSAQPEEGVFLLHLEINSDTPVRPAIFKLSWSVPLAGIHYFWRPGTDRSRSLPADWSETYTTQSTVNAPVGCLMDLNSLNRHTFVLSDVLNPVEIAAGVNEETATFLFSLTFFKVPTAPLQHYTTTLRLDYRQQPYEKVLAEAASWWESLPGLAACPTPAPAREPVYSTWYNFHQRLVPAELIEECHRANQLGCKVLIVDDGWQTGDSRRGYAYCGDWEVYPDKIPDMRSLVAAIHDLGMKFVLWYSVPFVGEHTRVYKKFEGRYLGYLENFQAWVLDPRYPEVRDYLIGIYERALVNWDLDGFKLDFVQHFKQPEKESPEAASGQDYASVPEATEKLLSDLLERLQAAKPDILIEFRQPYTGPLMRRFGNMFRAGDCPNDSLRNRVRTLDIRLLSGQSAVHADMLMWHMDDPVESAALQLLNVLFAVPQLSVKINLLPLAHLEMITFWLSFWLEHRLLLLDGNLKPSNPEQLYPLVEIERGKEKLVAFYSRVVYRHQVGNIETLYLINATLAEGVVTEFMDGSGQILLEIFNCQGKSIMATELPVQPGLLNISVPPAGLAILKISRPVADETKPDNINITDNVFRYTA